jgi:hypothetical protein
MGKGVMGDMFSPPIKWVSVANFPVTLSKGAMGFHFIHPALRVNRCSLPMAKGQRGCGLPFLILPYSGRFPYVFPWPRPNSRKDDLYEMQNLW